MPTQIEAFQSMTATVRSLEHKPEHILKDPIEEGKWSIREIVGHLTYWDSFNLHVMVPHMKDEGDLPPFPDHDAQNEKAMEAIEGVPAASVMQQFIATRKELIAAMNEIDDQVRFTIGGGKRGFSRDSFITIFVKHDKHHEKQIRRKLGE